MSKYIDADLYIEMQICDDEHEEWGVWNGTIEELLDQWTVQGCPQTMVDIVRCKDCKHRVKSQWVENLDGTEKRYKCNCIGEYMLERNFCSFGERIEE